MMEYLQQISRRLKLIASRGVVTKVDDSGDIQQVQAELLAGEIRDMVRVQNYGLTSVPLKGAQVVTQSLGGNRGQSVVMAAEDTRHRPKNLKEGEVCLYTHEGDRIHLKEGRIIAIESGVEVQVTAPAIKVTGETTITGNVTLSGNITMTGNLSVTGGITATGDVQGMGKSLALHTHSGGTIDGMTGAPV